LFKTNNTQVVASFLRLIFFLSLFWRFETNLKNIQRFYLVIKYKNCLFTVLRSPTEKNLGQVSNTFIIYLAKISNISLFYLLFPISVIVPYPIKYTMYTHRYFSKDLSTFFFFSFYVSRTIFQYLSRHHLVSLPLLFPVHSLKVGFVDDLISVCNEHE